MRSATVHRRSLGLTTPTCCGTTPPGRSIISWQPVTYGGRVFCHPSVRVPLSVGGSGDVDRIFCYDLETGDELWDATVPFAGDPDEEWIAYVGGAHDGRVYAARGGSGRTTPVYAFDANTGALLWDSVHETVAGPQDGFVFDEATGDVVVGDFDNVARLSALDGSVVWVEATAAARSPATAASSIGDGCVYIDEPAGGGNVVTKLDLATGARLYSSPTMPGLHGAERALRFTRP